MRSDIGFPENFSNHSSIGDRITVRHRAEDVALLQRAGWIGGQGKTLRDIEAVQKRPGMYSATDDGSGMRCHEGYPNPKIFIGTSFDFAVLEQRFRMLASLGANVALVLIDKRGVDRTDVVIDL